MQVMGHMVTWNPGVSTVTDMTGKMVLRNERTILGGHDVSAPRKSTPV
jgi:hypothetical protein